jgi:hypothetical protein
MKHVIDTQWVSTPTRERLAAARKRTLRSVSARSARSVWSKCQSREIESRNSADRLGLPVPCRGGNTVRYEVSRPRSGTQAKYLEAGPGSENRAKAYGGILGSWESPHRSTEYCRKRMIPAYQHPNAWAEFPAAHAIEARETLGETVSEGNRSRRVNGCGRRSGLVVAFESRRTEPKGACE